MVNFAAVKKTILHSLLIVHTIRPSLRAKPPIPLRMVTMIASYNGVTQILGREICGQIKIKKKVEKSLA